MSIAREPVPALRPFVSLLWASSGAPGAAGRERVLPTGAMHLVVRLGGPPLRVFDGPQDTAGRTLATALVGGARAHAYLRDATSPSRSVGAQLRPGAAALLLGAPAGVLAGRHTSLADLWGREAALLQERLEAAGSPAAQLALFEQHLVARVLGRGVPERALAAAARHLAGGGSVRQAVEASGLSHRHFLARFREAAGLAPKLYGRVLRLQRVLARIERAPEEAWVDVALEAGYADQAHLVRDFRELTGLTPGEYRALRPPQSHHVPLGR